MPILKRLLIIVAVAALVLIGAIVGIGFFLSPQDKLHQSDLIVAVSGGETRQRTYEAVRLYKEGYAPRVLFSGAAADRSGPSNAAVMRADALEQGVPAKAILIEDQSETTAENALDAAPIIHRTGVHSLILVTSPYHQRRASINFHRALGSGVTIINHSATDSVWRKNSWWTKPSTIALTFQELQKIVYIWSTRRQ